MTQPGVELGPFALDRVIGTGAMGRVWCGEHVRSGLPVAIKVARLGSGHGPDEFLREARAMASLTHPGIVTILDVGVAGADADAASMGLVAADSPYIAMELCESALSKAAIPMPWTSVVFVMQALLDALAHAHARRVLHRDLKPGNILIGRNASGAPILKLTDFGIADLAGGHQDRSGQFATVAGTPLYMPPEQFLGRFREYGPWTDLYAVGAIAWRLLTRQYPVVGGSMGQLLTYHTGGVSARLPEALDIPPGLRSWIERCVELDPWRRFQTAADAARALAGAVPEINDESDRASLLFASVETDEEADLLEGVRTLIVGPPAVSGALPDSVASAQVGAPPVPESWESRDVLVSPRLQDAGLALFGLRARVLRGREREREAMWKALRATAEDRAPRVVILRGAAGAGKSALARWFCERAVEAGAAYDLRVHYSGFGGERDGLAGALAIKLRCLGLSYDDALAHSRLFLGRTAAPELAVYAAEIIAGAVAPPPAGRTASRLRETHLLQAVSALAGPRVGLVWLDNIEVSSEAVPLVETAVSLGLPIVFCLTAQEEALRASEQARTALDAMYSEPYVTAVPVGPLNGFDHVDFVAGLLSLEPSLVEHVAVRTSGNPNFAVDIVADWVSRDALELGPDGFRLRDASLRDRLPASVEAAWRAHLERVLEALPEGALMALAVAAALGLRIDAGEWVAALAYAGVPHCASLYPAMLSAGLATPTESGWAFTQGMVHETAQSMAAEAGFTPAAHQACAHALADDDRPSTLERRSYHQRLGLDLVGARATAAAALTGWLDQGRVHPAFRVLHSLESLRDALRAAPTTAEIVDVARLLRRAGDHQGAGEVLSSGVKAHPTNPEILIAYADHISEWEGDQHRAVAVAEELYGNALEQGDGGTAARAARVMGVALARLGQFTEALPHLEAALELGGDAEIAARRVMSYCYRELGRIGEAVALAEQNLSQARTDGHVLEFVSCLVDRGENRRLVGELDAALADYEAALEWVDSLGVPRNGVMQYNIALTHLGRGDLGAAREWLSTAVADWAPTASDELTDLEYACRVVEGQSGEVPQGFDERVAAGGWECAWLLQSAGLQALAAESGDAALGADFVDRAIALWTRLGHTDTARRLRERMSS